MKLGFLNKTTGDLNEQDYIWADTLPIDYTDITSVTNIDMYWGLSNRDYKFAKYEMVLLVQSIGYVNLSTAEKILANKWFASGVEYNNSEVTTSQQNAFFNDFVKPNSDHSRVYRDLVVTQWFIQRLYTGVLLQSVIDDLIKTAEGLRTKYLRDGTTGIGYGDTIEGVINFVKNDSSFLPFSIVAVNTGTKTFSVDGDETIEFPTDKIIRIHSATGNDGAYTVVSSSFDNTNTNIIVAEVIPNATADGDIYVDGLMWYEGLTFSMQDDIYNAYWNGIY